MVLCTLAASPRRRPRHGASIQLRLGSECRLRRQSGESRLEPGPFARPQDCDEPGQDLRRSRSAHPEALLQHCFRGVAGQPPITVPIRHWYRRAATHSRPTMTTSDCSEPRQGQGGSGTAPAVGVNTGVMPGGSPSRKQPVQSRQPHGIKVTLPNGNVFWIMKRCGNVVVQAPAVPNTPAIPGVPQKPPSSQELKNCRKVDPNANTDAVLCEKRNVNALPATHFFPPQPRTPGAPSGSHSVAVVHSQETPTTISGSGATNTPFGSNTPNVTRGRTEAPPTLSDTTVRVKGSPAPTLTLVRQALPHRRFQPRHVPDESERSGCGTGG